MPHPMLCKKRSDRWRQTTKTRKGDLVLSNGKKEEKERTVGRTRRVNALLHDRYFNLSSPSSFSSPCRLWQESRWKDPSIPLDEVNRWLSAQRAYTLHKRVFLEFPHRKVVTAGIDKQWQVDLVDVSSLSKHNNGENFLLTVIDVFSCKAFVRALKTKKSSDVAKAFVHIMTVSKRQCIKLQTDHGKEFVGKLFDQMLKGRRIIQIHTHQDIKAHIVERLNRTFKGLLFKYMKYHKTYRYIHLLQDFVDSYNSRPHHSIGGYVPNDINKSNESKIFDLQYSK